MQGWKQLVQQALSMGRIAQVLQFVEKYSWVVDKDVAQHVLNVIGISLPITSPKHSPTIDKELESLITWQQLKGLMLSNPDAVANFPASYYHIYCELCLNQHQENQFIETILKHGNIMNPGVIERLYELYLQKGGIDSVKLMLTIKVWDEQVKMMNLLFD